MEKRLGKGLGALISEDITKSKEIIKNAKIINIKPNPFQPRKRFQDNKMEELVSSIKEKGVIQPILVRPIGEKLEIIAGERRWRAAKQLGVEEVPVIIKNDIDDANSLEISLIENIQREELNPIEEANAYKELSEKFEYTLDKIGQMMGKDKTTISNSIRLLSLSEEIKQYVEEGTLSAGHAKVLLSVQNERKRNKITKTILLKGLSVRETEQLVGKIAEVKTKTKKTKDPEQAQIEENLQHRFGTKIQIKQGKKRGRIEIQFFSSEDLQRILRLLMG